MPDKLLQFTEKGIYCPKGDFYIDPWRPVDKAVITHGHSDHARWGMKHYLAHSLTAPIMRHRLGDIDVETLPYGEQRKINGVAISLHPAGHIPGSAQVRVAHKGEVWVVSGDYKTTPDPLAEPFEVVPCQHFITESTFGLPVFRWPEHQQVADEINAWWKQNAAEGRTSVLFAYALGKAQRLLAMIDPSIGPIYTHGAVENTNIVLRGAGLAIPDTTKVEDQDKKDFEKALVIAPPSAQGSSWMKRFVRPQTAFASGWMMMRGTRRRRNADRGFVLSDHADWDELNATVDATGAEHIYVTHGYTDTFARYLRERGLYAKTVKTDYTGEQDDNDD